MRLFTISFVTWNGNSTANAFSFSNKLVPGFTRRYKFNFLYTYYTDIFNKVKKDEIDINLLYKFLDILKKIEEGQLDQHEGSFMVCTILKDIYVDSALKKAEKLDANFEKEKIEPKKANVNVSWKQFKKMNK